ncbi:PREDICTED: metallo-beta-lactamase domain-containing protein 1 isoform X2 [Papilio polytes]|uniref:metallo-beta-lactamase domain-containing protein 1 isoform X2 n=1 Tax=Papilio polytes TaxID=76194 RepID=UPI0006767E80|nr:PREDICTED: metallo-beta-lactamase domain-containing protein 1 isoform X2 [Papilio polytes]
MSEIAVLFNGYSTMSANDEMTANCTCTLIKGAHNIIVDTMTAWDSDKIISALKSHGVIPEDINYVVSTHGHSDHIGNNNLFLKAKHIVGFSISYKDKYYIFPFDKGQEYVINESVKVVPTPGHTLSDVTVLVKSNQGDLFEKHEDIEDPNIWLEAGSEDKVQQARNRSKIADIADWIMPGHGAQFQVTKELRQTLRKQIV